MNLRAAGKRGATLRRAAVWLDRLLWATIVTAVVSLGVVVSLGRHYIGYVERYQQELVAELNHRTGLQISVGRLRGEWQRLSPQLRIDDLRLHNPTDPAEVVFAAEHVTVRLGLFHSLQALLPVFTKIEAQGVRAVLDERRLGHWQLRGFPYRGGGNVDAVLDTLLAVHRAELNDSRIDLHFFNGNRAELHGDRLELERAGRFRRLEVALAFAADGAPLTLKVEARGDPRDTDTFSAQAYMEFTRVDLSPLLPMAQAFGVDLRHGRIDGAAWAEWQRGGAFAVRGRLRVPILDLTGLTGRPMQPIEDIAAEFLLRDDETGRRLWLPRIDATWAGEQLALRQLRFSQLPDQAGSLQLDLPQLELAPLRRALLADRVLPESMAEALGELAPDGRLQALHLTLPLAPAHWQSFRLRSEVAGGAVTAWHGAPAVEGVDGYVEMNLDGGVADVASDRLSLAFPKLYHQPLKFDRARGRVGWRLEDNRVRVDSGPLRVEGEPGQAVVRLALDLPLHPDGSDPLMTLVVGMRNSDARYRDLFVPHTLNPALLSWLERAVRGGQLPQGAFIYRGSLVAHDALDRTVQLYLDVRDGELAYHPDWPALHGLDAELWLDDAHLRVNASRGQVYDHLQLSDARVELDPERDGHGSWLTVEAAVDARGEDVLKLVRETPLQAQSGLGQVLDEWHWDGPAEAELTLGIPIDSKRAARIGVESRLGPGRLELGGIGLTIDGVQGPLSYHSDRGLRSAGLTGKLYGRPVAARFEAGKDGVLELTGSGKIAAADLRSWLGQPLLDFAKGETEFHASLRLGSPIELRVDSDLKGIALELPPPYGKAAAEPLPLALRMPQADGERRLMMSLGEWADLDLHWSQQVLRSGVVRLGRAGSDEQLPGRLVITGEVPPIDLAQWRAVTAGRPEAGAATPAATPLGLTLRDLYLPEVITAGQSLREVQVEGEHRGDAWRLRLRSDKLAGELTVPDGEGPWVARLDYLRLAAPDPDPDPGAEEGSSALAGIDPAQALPVDLSIAQLWRGEENWGSVGFQLRPIADGLRLENLTGQLRGLAFEGLDGAPASLSWTRRGGVDHSRFAGRLAVADLGAVMQRWNYERAITSKRGWLDARVDWHGRPDEIELTRLNGEAAIRIDDGRFLKASGSATGALKVVGIFNFANLVRRLRLDFSDLFRDGISFDRIDGGFQIAEGRVTITRPLQIESPSSEFRLSGRLDFNTDEAAMELVARLPLASNLPWVAALAGGLPAAAGVYVASKLFGEQVDRYASAVYDVTGPWRDPKVKFRRIFDAEGGSRRRDETAQEETR